MKYVGNLKKSGNFFDEFKFGENEIKSAPSFNEKAIFPPGSIIPDIVSQDAENFEEFKNNFSVGELFGDVETLKKETDEAKEKSNSTATGNSTSLKMAKTMPQKGENILDNLCVGSKSLGDFLCMYIGKRVAAEFLFGADTYVKKTGILVGTGLNFVVLKTDEGSETLCDLTDIKFITFI